MRLSSIITFLSLAVLPATLASPVDNQVLLLSLFSLVSLFLLHENTNRYNRVQDSSIAKRCCILCDNPYARCGANDKREAVQTEEEVFHGQAKRCCVNCDVNRCGN